MTTSVKETIMQLCRINRGRRCPPRRSAFIPVDAFFTRGGAENLLTWGFQALERDWLAEDEVRADGYPTTGFELRF